MPNCKMFKLGLRVYYIYKTGYGMKKIILTFWLFYFANGRGLNFFIWSVFDYQNLIYPFRCSQSLRTFFSQTKHISNTWCGLVLLPMHFFLSLAFTECPSISDLIFLAPFYFDESVHFHHMNVTFCKEEKNISCIHK